ncbi:citrate synthase [Alteribacillus bidgolensis]|uniref:Citrate synthase n=1 Tax=Alteribacillus bidgolensis TaxID=930129 RepID=A0A1G8K2C1_9BACI|nr:citrate synthase [Alteribacillus bidgolensis]SDI37553.1 citrate synthase [Alteribacillus bidgolensis]
MLKTKGLEGIVATTSCVSSIIDDQLRYQGYNIDDLTENASFEEVIYLLWNGRLPKKTELNDLKKQLSYNSALPKTFLDQMKSSPLKDLHPMAALRTWISYLSFFDTEADKLIKEANYRKAIRIQAKIPTIVAAFARIRQNKDPLEPREDLNYAANFLYMLTGNEPEKISVEAVNKALIIHADHELNASTFTSRVCVATLSDLYSGVTAAIGALKGPLHGGANTAVMEMLMQIGEVENVEPYIRKTIDNKQKIMGFGHRVYKQGDPRAKHLKEMSKQLTLITGERKWYEMSLEIEKIVTREKGLLPNVDFYSASVYHSLGIKHDLFTPIFAISRTSGWIAHILEQYDNNRLIRPRAEYIGAVNKTYTPLENR